MNFTIHHSVIQVTKLISDFGNIWCFNWQIIKSIPWRDLLKINVSDLREYGNLWDSSCSLHQHLNWVEGIVLNNMAKVCMVVQLVQTKPCILHTLNTPYRKFNNSQPALNHEQHVRVWSVFQPLLQENVDVCVWWLFQVTRLSQSKPASREQLIRQFVLEWTYISTQILKLVTFISPAALGRVQFSRFNASIFF